MNGPRHARSVRLGPRFRGGVPDPSTRSRARHPANFRDRRCGHANSKRTTRMSRRGWQPSGSGFPGCDRAGCRCPSGIVRRHCPRVVAAEMWIYVPWDCPFFFPKDGASMARPRVFGGTRGDGATSTSDIPTLRSQQSSRYRGSLSEDPRQNSPWGTESEVRRTKGKAKGGKRPASSRHVSWRARKRRERVLPRDAEPSQSPTAYRLKPTAYRLQLLAHRPPSPYFNAWYSVTLKRWFRLLPPAGFSCVKRIATIFSFGSTRYCGKYALPQP